MSQLPAKFDPEKVDLALWSRVAYLAATGAFHGDDSMSLLKWLKNEGMSQAEALSLVSNPEFIDFFHQMQKSIAKSEYNAVVFDRLLSIIRDGGNRDAISASKTLASLVDYKDDSPKVLNFNFDRAVRTAKEAAEEVEAEIIQEYPGL